MPKIDNTLEVVIKATAEVICRQNNEIDFLKDLLSASRKNTEKYKTMYQTLQKDFQALQEELEQFKNF